MTAINFKIRHGLDIGDDISIDDDKTITGLSTDNLTEGTTNVYYTDTRVDTHLSGGVGVDYTTGVISIGQPVATTDDVIFSDLTLQNQTSGGGANLTGDILGSVVVSGYDGAEWVKDNLANVELTFKAAENFANDGLGNTTASGTDLDWKLQTAGYRVNSQALGTTTVDSRLGLFRTLSTGLETITAGNTSTIESPGRRVLYIGDTTANYLPYQATNTDGTKEYLGYPRTDILYQNSNFVVGGVPNEQYCEFTVDSFVSTPSAGDARAFLGQSGVPNDILGVIIQSITPPSYIRSGSTINSIHSSSVSLPTGTMVLGFLSTAPAGGGYYIHRYRVNAFGGYAPTPLGTNNVRVSNYELLVTETSGSIGVLDTIYDPISATQNAKIIKATDNTVWTNYEPITTGATSCGPDNYAIRDTNVIEFITSRQNAQIGRRSPLKSGDTISVIKATGINSYNQGQATETNSYESFLKIVATDNYSTTTGGSAFEVELIKTGTTTPYTALDLQSTSATVRSDDLYLKDSNDVEIWGDRIHYNRVYGDFVDTDTHGPAPVNTTQTVQFNTLVLANGISIVNGGEITFAHNNHTYSLTTNLSFAKTGGGDADVSVWLVEKEPLGVETTVSNSRHVIAITGNGARATRSLTWMIDPLIGEYYKIYWQSDATGVSLEALPAVGVLPGAPSAAVQITPVGA